MFHPQTTGYVCFSVLFFPLGILAVAPQKNRDVKKANNTYKDLNGMNWWVFPDGLCHLLSLWGWKKRRRRRNATHNNRDEARYTLVAVLRFGLQSRRLYCITGGYNFKEGSFLRSHSLKCLWKGTGRQLSSKATLLLHLFQYSWGKTAWIIWLGDLIDQSGRKSDASFLCCQYSESVPCIFLLCW